MLVSEIKPYEKNAKKHPTKQVKQIAASIKEFGFNQPIVVDKNNVVIVGHGRLEAAKLLKIEDVPVITVDLTEEQAKAYRLADNKLNETDWDMGLVVEELKGLSAAMFDLTGFDEDLLLEDEAKDDAMPEEVQTVVKLDDLWDLGGHRLLCGSSTDEVVVDRLMDGKKAQMVFTDPPYNVDYTGSMNSSGKNSREGILNDKMSKIAFEEFLSKVSQNINKHCQGGVYICMSSSEIDTLKRAYELNGGHWQSFIIWVKNNFTLSRADYQNTYEPILYGWSTEVTNHFFTEDRTKANVFEDLQEVKTKFDGVHTTICFHGFEVKIKGKVEGSIRRKQSKTDIWRYDKPTKSVEHPTMKPVALVQEAITNSSERGDIVLDLFGGSGTTIIAAEKTERVCYMMELDPKYCDVIIARYELYTGKKAIKL